MSSARTPTHLLSTTGFVGLALAVGLLAFWLTAGLLSRLELAATDLLFLLRGPLESEGEVVIVAIDDASFSATGLQWPWPRDYLAQIVSAVDSGQPRVIAIDVLFYERSNPQADRALADAIAQAGNVVLSNDISLEARGGYVAAQLNRPLPELDAAAAAVGLANIARDEDGAVRRLLAFQEHNEQLVFSWAFQVARLFLGVDSFSAVSGDEVRIANHYVRLDDQTLLVNFGGPAGSLPIYSAYQVADGTVDPEVFAGKAVLIGATSESLHDTYATPYGSAPPMPGVEIYGHALATILEGRTLQPASGISRAVLAVLAALAGMGLVLRLRPAAGLGALLALMLAYMALAFVLFIQSRLVLPMTGPLLAVGLTYVTGSSIQLVRERRRRAHIRALFERYVAPAVIDRMLAGPGSFAPGGQRRELTVLFSDIRGFTSLSEQLEPDEVVTILNEYLSAMTEVVFEHEGTIDKFEGDAIIAVFNAPLDVDDHASKAVRCALGMVKRLADLQATWAAAGRSALRIGIGLNTGEAFVGNIGSARRMDYTVIGDTVNVASRLQELTKEQGVPILITEATRQKLGPDIKTRFATTAKVRGRTQSVNVFAIEDAEENA